MSQKEKLAAPLFGYGVEAVFCEPSWYQFFDSPYYNENHRKFRDTVRMFVDKELNPYIDDWEESHVKTGYEMPAKDIIRKAHSVGIYSPMWPKELGGTPPTGGWDAFYDLIWNDEISRALSAGPKSIFSITTMALPPLLDHGSEYLQSTYAVPVIRGEKYISLCISEPYAGSDVGGIRATATKNGEFYVISGEKKWITMGYFADYFTVAARTGDQDSGAKGISLFLVERSTPGITVHRMKLQGSWLAGTSMVIFDNVQVPCKNMIGKENNGFKIIMHNFNHERYVIAVQANRGARGLFTEAFHYASQRKTFGKRLIEHQVIRQKLADMAMRIEAVHALIETVTYQMSKGITQERLGGVMALLKVNATRTLELCVRETAQIFGGASYVRGGVGVRVERAAREVRGAVVPGGSDEILSDLAIRQAIILTQRYHLQKDHEKSKL
jgi:alkylation response protein AidB-like acyl-CoA dehydrogenase